MIVSIMSDSEILSDSVFQGSEYSETVHEITPRSHRLNMDEFNTSILKSILIVDDDPMNQEALKVVLGAVLGQKYNLECASNGKDAI